MSPLDTIPYAITFFAWAFVIFLVGVMVHVSLVLWGVIGKEGD
jgi:hypothetical protein